MSQSAITDSPMQPILVPVDFEPAARAALIFGARLAACKGAPLKILHVVHEPADRPNYYQRHAERDAVLPIEVLAERLLGEFLLDIYRSDPELHALETPDVLLVKGLPSSRIPEVAWHLDASQIVMGHKKARGMFRNLFASLPERVAHSCGIPVTVVYANGSPETAEIPHQGSIDGNVALGA